MVQMRYLPLNKITTRKQVRSNFDQEAIEGLAATLRIHGQLQPIRVQKVGDEFVIVDGERRFRAAPLADMSELQCLVEDHELSQTEVTERSLVANCQREDLTPLEEARGIALLMEVAGLSASGAATRLGMTNSKVSRALSLLSLSADVQEQIAAGKIAASAAIEIAKVRDPERQEALAAQVAAGQLTRDGVAAAAKSKVRIKPNRSKPVSRRMVAMLGMGRSVTVVGQTLSLEAVVEWLEDLLARARKAKSQCLSLSTFEKLLADQAKS